MANLSRKLLFLARIIRSISWRNCSVLFLFPSKGVGLAIAGPLDLGFPVFVDIILVEGSGLLEALNLDLVLENALCGVLESVLRFGSLLGKRFLVWGIQWECFFKRVYFQRWFP